MIEREGLMPKSKVVWAWEQMSPYCGGAHCVGRCAAKGTGQSCPGPGALLESLGFKGSG